MTLGTRNRIQALSRRVSTALWRPTGLVCSGVVTNTLKDFGRMSEQRQFVVKPGFLMSDIYLERQI